MGKGMLSRISLMFLAAGLAACAITPPAPPITSIKLMFPKSVKWTQITDKTQGDQFIREWVPEGSTGDDTKWILVEQKFDIGHPVSAKDYIESMFNLARGACAGIKYNGPKEMDAGGHDAYVGRFMCSQEKGKNYGTFTDERVIAQGNYVYVITSELHLPPSPRAGVLTFPKGHVADMMAFMGRQGLSAQFVRSLKVCTVAAPCPE